jgi:hypothetical protein
MYAVVRMYEMSDDWDEDLEGRLNEGFIPLIEQAPGFISYLAVEGDKRLFCSVTVFQDRAGATASNRLAADYVQQHLAGRFPTSPEITMGEVRASRAV